MDQPYLTYTGAKFISLATATRRAHRVAQGYTWAYWENVVSFISTLGFIESTIITRFDC